MLVHLKKIVLSQPCLKEAFKLYGTIFSTVIGSPERVFLSTSNILKQNRNWNPTLYFTIQIGWI